MQDNWNYEMKMAFAFMLLMLAVVTADNVSNADVKETPIPSENAPLEAHNEHHLAKRAWQQLQSGWGKRSPDDDNREESLEELKHRILQLYADQLNRVDVNEFAPEEYDLDAEKRAWKQMSNAWGKRDWSQLRGNGWGKRTPGWNKLSSAWGK